MLIPFALHSVFSIDYFSLLRYSELFVEAFRRMALSNCHHHFHHICILYKNRFFCDLHCIRKSQLDWLCFRISFFVSSYTVFAMALKNSAYRVSLQSFLIPFF